MDVLVWCAESSIPLECHVHPHSAYSVDEVCQSFGEKKSNWPKNNIIITSRHNTKNQGHTVMGIDRKIVIDTVRYTDRQSNIDSFK